MFSIAAACAPAAVAVLGAEPPAWDPRGASSTELIQSQVCSQNLSSLVHYFLFGGIFPLGTVAQLATDLWEGAELCHGFSGTDSILKQRKGGTVSGEGSCSDRQTLGAAWSPAAADTALGDPEQVKLELENKNRQS